VDPTPTTAPTTPYPIDPTTTAQPSPAGKVGEWCPSADDFTVAYSAGELPHMYDQGYSINGGGGVATKVMNIYILVTLHYTRR